MYRYRLGIRISEALPYLFPAKSNCRGLRLCLPPSSSLNTHEDLRLGVETNLFVFLMDTSEGKVSRMVMSKTSRRKKLDRKSSDRISILPDEILGSIQSLLTIKEAAGTSVLSKRWMHLWKIFTVNLIFDDSKKLFCGNAAVVKRERPKYVKWVNKVIDSHQGNSIDELCVWFDLDNRFSSDIDKWVEFAISKRVKRLTVDLIPVTQKDEDVNYSLRAGLVEIPTGSSNTKFLTNLCFRFVNITGKLLEYFLCNCPLLETLSVTSSCDLGRLVVPSSALQLKCLEIFYCRSDHVEIKAPNLVTLKYFGSKEALHFGNLSELVDLTLGGGLIHYHAFENEKLCMFSSYLCQLQFLKLSTNPRSTGEFIKHLHLPNLKHLTLLDFGCDAENLLGWLSLINASPSLQKCTLELQNSLFVDKRKMMLNAPALSHQCLKVVEVLGFEGKISQLNLAMYMIKSSIKLEKLVIDRRLPRLCVPTPAWDFKETKKTRAAKVSAMQLKKTLPPGAILFVK